MYLPIQDDKSLPKTAFTTDGGEELGLPTLKGKQTADVLIVGGGIAGCSAALHSAGRASRVIVLEANKVAWGASGRNGGHVAPATKHDPDEIVARYGMAAGQRLIDAAEEGPKVVGDLVMRHGIDCEFSVPGIISAAHTHTALKAMEKRVDYWQARGRPVELLDRRQAAEKIGSDYYLGAWIDRRGARINPLAYTRGLARAAIKAGAAIYENSRATKIERQGGKWLVKAEQGEVQADFVFLCTNAYTDDLWPGLRQSVISIRAYQLQSKPLRDNIRKTILPGGQPMTDSRRLLSGIRLHSDGRLQFGGQGPVFGAQREPAYAPSLARLKKIFPQLGDLETDGWWSGFMAMTNDNTWEIHELGPGLLAMLGCNGRGVALATIYGREFARYAHGTPAKEFVLPPTPVKRIFAHGMMQPFVLGLIQYYAVRDAVEIRRLERNFPVSTG